MKTTIKTFIAAGVAIGISTAAVAQSSPPPKLKLGLKEAILTAIKRQPSLASAKAQAAAANEVHKQALGAFYPSASLSYSNYQSSGSAQSGIGTSSSTTSTSGASGTSSGTGLLSGTQQADLVISYNIIDSGSRLATEQSSRASSKAANYSALDTRQTVIANAANDYFELLRRDALVIVQDSSVKHAQATLDLTQAQVNQGTQAQKDLYQAQADLATAKVDLLTAQNNRSVAEAQLKQALGITEEVEIETVDQTSEVAVSADGQQSLDSLLKTAHATRPDLMQAQQNVEMAKASVRQARANYGLTVSVYTGLSSVFLQNPGNSADFGITASLPIFTGGTNQAYVRQAQETQKQYEAQLASAQLSATLDVETAYRTLQTAKASVPAAAAAQQAAQISYDATLESRKEGIGTVVDVITAQSALVTAQTNYVQALYTLYEADVALQRAVGHADAVGGVK